MELIITEDVKFELENLREEKNIGVIYGHFNKLENKWYVGQTIHWEHPWKRWGSDGCNYKGDTKFSRAIERFGWENFEHHILSYTTVENLFEMETMFIKIKDSFKNGYNETEGDHGLSVEARIKISNTKKGQCSGKNNPMFGKIVSDETRQKLSISHTGKKDSEITKIKKSKSQMGHDVSDKVRNNAKNLNLGKSSAMKGITGNKHHSSKKVVQILDNVIIKEYDNIREAAEALSFVSGTSITNRCKNQKPLDDGSILKFADDNSYNTSGYKLTEEQKKKLSDSKKGRKNLKISKSVIQLDPITQDEIQRFNSAKDAAAFFNSKYGGSHITACCRGERKKAYGYCWRFYEN